jgi:hypothetical protein
MNGCPAHPSFFEEKPLADRATGRLDAILKNVENTFAVTVATNKNEKYQIRS